MLLSEYIDDKLAQSLIEDCLEIKRILIASLKTQSEFSDMEDVLFVEDVVAISSTTPTRSMHTTTPVGQALFIAHFFNPF